MKKKKEAMEKMALEKMRTLHADFVQKNGFPRTAVQWKGWHDYFEQNNFADEYIKLLFAEVTKDAAEGKFDSFQNVATTGQMAGKAPGKAPGVPAGKAPGVPAFQGA